MPNQQSDRDTFTRIMVALAVNDAHDMPTTSEIEQIADAAWVPTSSPAM